MSTTPTPTRLAIEDLVNRCAQKIAEPLKAEPSADYRPTAEDFTEPAEQLMELVSVLDGGPLPLWVQHVAAAEHRFFADWFARHERGGELEQMDQHSLDVAAGYEELILAASWSCSRCQRPSPTPAYRWGVVFTPARPDRDVKVVWPGCMTRDERDECKEGKVS